MKNTDSIEEYIRSGGQWQVSLNLLRDILLSAGLNEEVKWGGPVYTFEGKNIAGMAYFKSYVGLWFYQGVLLKDKNKKLINAQEGFTKALRQWRFSSVDEIKKESRLIKEYIFEAIENKKAGKEIKKEQGRPLIVPVALVEIFKTDKTLRNCFESLTLTKKRDFAGFISNAKTEATIQKRLEKIIPMIKAGEGLNDKYTK